MKTCVLVTKDKNSYLVDFLEHFTVKFKVVEEEYVFSNSMLNDFKIIIFDNVNISTILKYRSRNSLVRIIVIGHKEILLDKNIIFCQISSFLETPTDIDSFYNQIIILQNEYNNLRSNMYKKTNQSNLNEKFKNNEAKDYSNILSKNEQILLNLFLNNPTTTLSHDYILEHFFNFKSEVGIRTLKNIVSSLRKKIPEIEIKNVYGSGYLFKKIILNKKLDLYILDEFTQRVELSTNKQDLYDDICTYLLTLLNVDRSFIAEYKRDEKTLTILEEKTVEEFPGALNVDPNVALSTTNINVLESSLKHNEAYVIYPEPLESIFNEEHDFWNRFIHPKTVIFFPFYVNKKIYSIGLHQCSYLRKWKDDEIIFLKQIAFIAKSKLFSF